MADFKRVFRTAWTLSKDSVMSFVDDDVLSKGASIAFYTVTSIAPVLIIMIAIAGLAFGDAAAQGAITDELSGLIGSQSAQFLQSVVVSASNKSTSIIASVLGLLTLVVTASGVFSEMQSALNIIWKTAPSGGSVSRFINSRIASLGLVAALGLLLLLSLGISAVLGVLGNYIDLYLPFGHTVLLWINVVVSFLLMSISFAAIYKILPDTPLEWADVLVGAVVTAFLFEVGKYLIGLYIKSSSMISSYGAAAGLIVLLVWIYYSAQIFLLGAEFTKTYARYRDSKGK